MIDHIKKPCNSIVCRGAIQTFQKIELRHSPLTDKDKPPDSEMWRCKKCKVSYYTVLYNPEEFNKANEVSERPKFDSTKMHKKAFIDD